MRLIFRNKRFQLQSKPRVNSFEFRAASMSAASVTLVGDVSNDTIFNTANVACNRIFVE